MVAMAGVSITCWSRWRRLMKRTCATLGEMNATERIATKTASLAVNWFCGESGLSFLKKAVQRVCSSRVDSASTLRKNSSLDCGLHPDRRRDVEGKSV